MYGYVGLYRPVYANVGLCWLMYIYIVVVVVVVVELFIQTHLQLRAG